MNTIQLECFVAVAEYLNYARAAESLHITQPAVTHQIKSLETELNTKLFKRTTRTVALTQSCFAFLNDAKNILRLMHTASFRIKESTENKPKFFNIGSHDNAELTFLPDILAAMAKEVPEFHPIFKFIPYQAMPNLLQDESIDVMFDFLDENASRYNSNYYDLIRASYAFVLPPDHPFATRNVLTIEDMLNDKLIHCNPSMNARMLTVWQNHAAGFFEPAKTFRCETLSTAIMLVKAGLGFTILPDIPQLREASLHYVPFETQSTISFGIYYKSLNQNPLMKMFLAIAKEHFL